VLVNNAGIMNAGRPGDGLEEQLNAGRLSAVALDEVRTVFEANVFQTLEHRVDASCLDVAPDQLRSRQVNTPWRHCTSICT
jgi:NAD(P)-dependent dehydrogenase (short-subunit alcohol dehydrogenase family)